MLVIGPHLNGTRRPRSPLLDELLELEQPKDRRSQADQEHQVTGREGLRLEDPLERREVDDEQLADEGEADGREKRPVGRQADDERGLCLGAAGQSVEHVKEDEAGEGHGRVARGDDVVGHFPHEDEHGAGDYAEGGEEDVAHEGPGYHGLSDVAGWLADDLRVHGLDAQALSGRAVHDYVYPQDLHGVEGIGGVEERGQCYQRKCSCKEKPKNKRQLLNSKGKGEIDQDKMQCDRGFLTN